MGIQDIYRRMSQMQAFPVVTVQQPTTYDQPTLLQPQNIIREYWQKNQAINAVGMLTLRTSSPDKYSYVDAVAVYPADATVAAAGLQTLWLFDLAEAEITLAHRYYQPAAATTLLPTYYLFPYPLRFKGGVKLQLGVALTGGYIYVTVWGHDE